MEQKMRRLPQPLYAFSGRHKVYFEVTIWTMVQKISRTEILATVNKIVISISPSDCPTQPIREIFHMSHYDSVSPRVVELWGRAM